MIQVGTGRAMLHHGDCIEIMKSMPDGSVDSIVTDPPYELGFMGRSWDRTGIAYSVEMWRECLRVLKPGGHLLSFGGSRTYHRMACAIEDAGFEIRDQIMWVYGSGFPKSLDVSKAIDKQAGAERTGTGEMVRGGCRAARGGSELVGSEPIEALKWKELTEPATEAAKQWDGWGTALKPAHEPIVVARKPLIGTVAENVLQFGTGAINVDGCRVDLNGDYKSKANGRPSQTGLPDNYDSGKANEPDTIGRWPANLIHDGSDEVLAAFPFAIGATAPVVGTEPSSKTANTFGDFSFRTPSDRRDGGGSAARFFYCAKASKQDRDEGMGDSADRVLARSCQAQAEAKRGNLVDAEGGAFNKARIRKNNHPTVKPTDLMRYLCRLVTRPGGTVFDPFMGSGSTGKAAILDGFCFIGIDREEDHVGISEVRIAHSEKTFYQENSQQRLFA